MSDAEDKFVVPEVPVEDGRVSSVLREILQALGVMTSTDERDDDIIVTVERQVDGKMMLVPGTPVPGDSAVLRLCWSVVAGTNIVGIVRLRVRQDTSGQIGRAHV